MQGTKKILMDNKYLADCLLVFGEAGAAGKLGRVALDYFFTGY